MNFSKSRYTLFLTCPKRCWLSVHMPEKEVISPAVQTVLETGNEVGGLARGLFGEYYLAEVIEDGKQDLPAMIEQTKELMAQNTPIICEAAFSYEGLYCAVDILRREGTGWAIYEVKSTNSVKPINLHDIAYQKYVLNKCGVNVTGVNLVHLNKDYVRHDNIDIHKLFVIEPYGDKIQQYSDEVEGNLRQAEEYLSLKEEPAPIFSGKCTECPFREYCHRDMPQLSVLNLREFSKKYDCVNAGIVTLEQLKQSGVQLKAIPAIQLECSLSGKTHIDKKAIALFLKELTYPLYFLDFETEQHAIPKYDGSSPYQQIPCQYSLHYIEEEGGELKHKEFLGDSVNDPRRALAERLIEDIPSNACVIAYSARFERDCIKDLAELFPDLRERLLDIRGRIKDIAVPFEKCYYYAPAMLGRYSIKYVLPAVFQGDPELNYHNLEGVHNGSEAMNIYPEIAKMPPAEAAKARENLLKYCKLDTFAMVKLWQELVRVCK